jgi:hypothetical protein
MPLCMRVAIHRRTGGTKQRPVATINQSIHPFIHPSIVVGIDVDIDVVGNRNVRYYISGSECPGEGEVKLMDWINTHAIDKPKEVRQNEKKARTCLVAWNRIASLLGGKGGIG